jgi:hypothetical protein
VAFSPQFVVPGGPCHVGQVCSPSHHFITGRMLTALDTAQRPAIPATGPAPGIVTVTDTDANQVSHSDYFWVQVFSDIVN